jgi:hypothetical protein
MPRLMGEYGLPALMKDAKRFKVRGKGHEVSLSFHLFISLSSIFYLLSSIFLSFYLSSSIEIIYLSNPHLLAGL